METIAIPNDIEVLYVTAQSFPESVPQAYEQLHSKIAHSKNDRKYFGISWPGEDGAIIYKAAAESLEAGEAEKCGCGSFTIKKGKYICISIKDHMKDGQCIGNAFMQLLEHPEIDPAGYCLEVYQDYTHPDVKCMVPLK